MIRLLHISCIILFLSLPAISQVPDFISVKKRNGITVRNYYAGGWSITFKATDGRIYEGPIKRIANDSLWVTFYNVNKLQSIWNTIIYDTADTYSIPFHYKEIDHIILPTLRRRNGYLATLGRMMQYGGFGYDVANVVNSIYYKDSFTSARNLRNVGIATAVGIGGTILKSRFGDIRRRTKRYRIVYVNMQ